MQENQNCLFVRNMKKRYATKGGYLRRGHGPVRMRLVDMFAFLNRIIDESDPDTGLPQEVHAFQTGEALRECLQPDQSAMLTPISVRSLFSDAEWEGLPEGCRQLYDTTVDQLYAEVQDWSWLPLTGFLHDLGKVMATAELGGLPQWAVVGDTFPVGAPFSSANVFYACGFFKNNPDLNMQAEDHRTFGRYQRQCGFDRVDMSWGHDEYFYALLNRTVHHLPPHALYIVRYHSFYPWHTPATGERGYTELASGHDWKMLPLLKLFQRCDLYSKKNAPEEAKALWETYTRLIEQFIPGREPLPWALRPAMVLC